MINRLSIWKDLKTFSLIQGSTSDVSPFPSVLHPRWKLGAWFKISFLDSLFFSIPHVQRCGDTIISMI